MTSTEDAVTTALAQDMARVARSWYVFDTLAALCPMIVAAAADRWPDLDVGLTRMVHRRPSTVAASGDLPRVVDALQYGLDQGPGPDALATDSIADQVVTGDVGNDYRWPDFGPRANAETEVRSVLAVRLVAGSDSLGLLTLYARSLDAFDDGLAAQINVFATHAALALARVEMAEQILNLRAALQSNRQIGAAIGILMSQHRVTEDRAFELLRLVSQHANRKLREVADDVVQTGTLPGAFGV